MHVVYDIRYTRAYIPIRYRATTQLGFLGSTKGRAARYRKRPKPWPNAHSTTSVTATMRMRALSSLAPPAVESRVWRPCVHAPLSQRARAHAAKVKRGTSSAANKSHISHHARARHKPQAPHNHDTSLRSTSALPHPCFRGSKHHRGIRHMPRQSKKGGVGGKRREEEGRRLG